MPLLKNVVLATLFCLLFCTTELHALGSKELNLEEQKTTFSLDGLMKSLDGTVSDLGKSLGGTVNGLGKSLDGTVNNLGGFLGGTVNGFGEFLGETINGFGVFLEENGEAVIVVGVLFLYMIAENDCYYYGHGHHHGYDHFYHR